MTTDNKTLLPCPFCGGREVELRQTSTEELIACCDCGGRTGVIWVGACVASNACKRRELIAAWNRRAADVERATEGRSMSIDTQELRAVVERMTPGEWRVLREPCHFGMASDIACGDVIIAQTCGKYPQLEHDTAGIVALRNKVPLLLDELVAATARAEKAEAEVALLRHALEVLLARNIEDFLAALEAGDDCQEAALVARAALGGDDD